MVGKQELLDRVWGRPDANPEGIEEGNIARQIYELRSALGDTRSDAKFIVNVHGRGYQFVAHVTERIVEKETRGRAPAPSIADRPSEVASQGLPKSPNGSLVGVGNGREKGEELPPPPDLDSGAEPQTSTPTLEAAPSGAEARPRSVTLVVITASALIALAVALWLNEYRRVLRGPSLHLVAKDNRLV